MLTMSALSLATTAPVDCRNWNCCVTSPTVVMSGPQSSLSRVPHFIPGLRNKHTCLPAVPPWLGMAAERGAARRQTRSCGGLALNAGGSLFLQVLQVKTTLFRAILCIPLLPPLFFSCFFFEKLSSSRGTPSAGPS